MSWGCAWTVQAAERLKPVGVVRSAFTVRRLACVTSVLTISLWDSALLKVEETDGSAGERVEFTRNWGQPIDYSG